MQIEKWLRQTTPMRIYELSKCIFVCLVILATILNFYLVAEHPLAGLTFYLAWVGINFILFCIDSDRPEHTGTERHNSDYPIALSICLILLFVAPFGFVIFGSSVAYLVHKRCFGMSLEESMNVAKKVQANPAVAVRCSSSYGGHGCKSDPILDNNFHFTMALNGEMDIVVSCPSCGYGRFIVFDHAKLMYKHRYD